MKIALPHNPRPEDGSAGRTDDAFEEYDSAGTIARIARALGGLGAEVVPVPADRRLPWRLEEGRFDFVFNIAEGEGRRCREAVPAAVCELLGLPSTGSDPLTLALTLDKALARRVVSPEVPVARAVLVEWVPEGMAEGMPEGVAAELAALRYPVIAKPNDEGSSKGIRDGALAYDVDGAVERCRWLRARYDCPVLVEEFLPGAEVTVGVVGNGAEARVLGMMEIAPASGDGPFVYTVEAKRAWRRRVRYHVPPRLDAARLAEIGRLALTAYRLLGCRDIARIDFRLDGDGEPRFLECNPLPGLDPEYGDIVVLSRSLLPYEELVQGILRDAARRAGVRIPEPSDEATPMRRPL
jgi:D-alanine-D-alanine ligase